MLEYFAREVAANIGSEVSESISVTPAGGTARSIRVIVERVHELAEIGEMIELDGVALRAQCATSDVADLAIGDAVTVRETDYRVVGIEPHRIGRTVLVIGI